VSHTKPKKTALLQGKFLVMRPKAVNLRKHTGQLPGDLPEESILLRKFVESLGVG